MTVNTEHQVLILELDVCLLLVPITQATQLHVTFGKAISCTALNVSDFTCTIQAKVSSSACSTSLSSEHTKVTNNAAVAVKTCDVVSHCWMTCNHLLDTTYLAGQMICSFPSRRLDHQIKLQRGQDKDEFPVL